MVRAPLERVGPGDWIEAITASWRRGSRLSAMAGRRLCLLWRTRRPRWPRWRWHKPSSSRSGSFWTTRCLPCALAPGERTVAMRILMLTDRFPPEVRSAAHLFHDLAREFQRRQHEVAVISKAPSQYFANGTGRGRSLGWEDVEGVPTLRVRGFPIAGYHPILRGLDHLTLGWTFGRASERWPSADVILVYSPPLPLASAGARYARRFRVPFVLNVQDLYPQTAIDLKLLRNRLVIQLAERMEGLAYRRAARIVVHSPGNRAFLIERKGIPADRVRVIFNWVDTEAIRPGPRENSFRVQYGLTRKFVVSYAGVMGVPLVDGLRDRARERAFPELEPENR